MTHRLLQKVRVLATAEEYSDAHGQVGVIVQLRQMPDDPLPFISLKLNSGDLIEDLLPGDIEECHD